MENLHFDGIYQERWRFSWAMLVSGRVVVGKFSMHLFRGHSQGCLGYVVFDRPEWIRLEIPFFFLEFSTQVH